MLKCFKNFDAKKTGLFAAGVLFGTAGIKILSSKDAKKLYTNCTAAVLRAKEVVLKTATKVQENAEDIYAEAKQINEDRAAKEEEVFDGEEVTEETTAEETEITEETAEFYPYWFHVVIGDIVHGAGDDAGDPALLGIRARLFVRVV